MASFPTTPKRSASFDFFSCDGSAAQQQQQQQQDGSRTGAERQSRRASSSGFGDFEAGDGEDDEYEDTEDESSSLAGGASEGGPGIGARLVGSCLALMRGDGAVTGSEPAVKSPRGAPVRGARPQAGCSMPVSTVCV